MLHHQYLKAVNHRRRLRAFSLMRTAHLRRNMAAVSAAGKHPSPESSLINLTNLITRLEENLLSSIRYQRELVVSEYHRAKVTANVEHARVLLLQLERSLATVKSQTYRHTLQTDITQKRKQIKAIKQCLDTVAAKAENMAMHNNGFADDEVSSENGEDILATTAAEEEEEEKAGDGGEDISRRHHPSGAKSSEPVESEADSGDSYASTSSGGRPSATMTTSPTAPGTTAPTASDAPQHGGGSTLRNRQSRNNEPPASAPLALRLSQPATNTNTASAATATATATGTAFAPSSSQAHPATTAASTTPPPADPKTQATEASLSSSRAEQETLTTSLLSLATQLKSSTQSFQSTLDSEKSILSRAVEGLDRNITGMDAAGRRMGMLRRMTEGRGWWGRVLMYAWIFALWVVAVLIVFVGPKLRF